MSFLAPFFLIGAAGIAIPIVLHLIRRQTKGQQDFSSLMFLDPSPPILLHRSRIDQWLLLLLRGLALLLLAAAFARPYWNSIPTHETPHPELRRAILLDTSASMQREGVWPAAIEAINTIAKSSQPQASLAFYTFDNRVRRLVSHEDSMASSPDERSQKVLAAAAAVRPTFRGTDLGMALATVGDQLVRTEETENANSDAISEIILISDLQAGSQIDRLENYQWPITCKLTIRRIEPKTTANVSANILVSNEENLTTSVKPASPGSAESKKDSVESRDKLAVRLSNDDREAAANVKLRWVDIHGGNIDDENEIDVEVPASGSSVVRISKLRDETARLHLEGDAAVFDNERYLAKPPKRNFDIVCIDIEQREATESLGYFLNQLPLGDETRDVRFVWRSPDSELDWPDRNLSPLIVASHDIADADAKKLRMFIEKGGHGLWVLDQSLEDSKQLAIIQSHWNALTGDTPPDIREAKSDRDAMFEVIDFTHPLFRSLADSKFNDFTKIRFWRHRCIGLERSPEWVTIARYDDTFPAIAYRNIGEGTLWLMTSGWQPSESQLALSSKFVPILASIFSLAAPVERSLDSIVTGDKIECLEGERWRDMSGTEMEVETDPSGKRTIVIDKPGFYQIERDNQNRFMAVNLPGAESDTVPMEIERLERLGVSTSDSNPTPLAIARKEQLRGVELEGQQRIWRWLMLGMLGAIVIETIWATRGNGN